jgi:hypothetical protein
MLENQAFYREPDGTYFINFDKMQDAVVKLVQNIIKEQGDGSYELAKKNVEENGIINDQLKEDLKRIEDAGIPVDIIFQLGKDILRL